MLRRVRVPLIATIAVFSVGWLAFGMARVAAAAGMALAAWLVVGAVAVLVRRWWGRDFARAVRATPTSTYGLVLAHAGLGVLVAGVTAMSAWQSSKILVMRPGERVVIGPSTVQLDGLRQAIGPNYATLIASFTMTRDNRPIPLVSERRFYPASRTQTTEAGISAHVLGNTYVAVGELQGNGGIVVRLYDHPLVGWIWSGAVLMALGGIVSLADRRFRVGAASAALRAAPPRLAFA